MKKWLLAFCAASILFSATGCTGTFALTQKVYTFQRSFDNKWVDELCFLGFVILPVYGICMFIDGLIINSIEFWTENNPVSGEHVVMNVVTPEGENLRVAVKGDTLEATDVNGDLVFTAVREAGRVVCYNPEGEVLHTTAL